MAYTTQTAHNRSFGTFCINRVSRIVPTYVVLTIVFCATMGSIFYATGFHDSYSHMKLKDIARSLAFVPLNLNTPTEAPMWGTSSLSVGWTLNYEMYFYSVFAVSLMFGRARWLFLFAWMFLTLTAFPFVACGFVTLDAYTSYGWKIGYLNLVTSPLIWEFVAGVLIYFLYRTSIQFPSRQTAWASVAVATSFTIWLLLSGPRPGFGLLRWGYLYIILFSTLLVADKTIRFEVPSILLWFGSISFSLYLMHPIVIHSIGVVLYQYDAFHPVMTGVPYVAFLTSLSVLAAIPAHRWLEVGLSERVRQRAQSGLNTIRIMYKSREVASQD